MSLLLHIDTAVQAASVCLSQGTEIVGFKSNPSPKDSAAWLQPAIQELMQENRVSLQQLRGVSVSAGPGSYTGLRVGMATAKGLCYALNIPLITVGTLKMMAAAALAQGAAGTLLVPMIDARRMEVFTAVYDLHLNEVVAPHNAVLTPDFFRELLEEGPLVFFGNGSEKLQPVLQHTNASFADWHASAQHLVPLAFEQFEKHDFANLAYAEPLYCKAFYSPLNPLKSGN